MISSSLEPKWWLIKPRETWPSAQIRSIVVPL
jgi:hypothetical protein